MTATIATVLTTRRTVCVLMREMLRWPQVPAADDQTQSGPSGLWFVVFVPIGGPRTRLPVSTMTLPPLTSNTKRSRPQGAGPACFSPTRLYFEPWQGHSNHCEL